jgi:hypothetical protein
VILTDDQILKLENFIQSASDFKWNYLSGYH